MSLTCDKKVITLVVCICAFSAYAYNQDKFDFVSISGLVDQEIAAKLATVIFNNAGLKIRVEPMPAARARYEATSGRRDGELARIYDFGVKHPDLIRVPTPYYEVKTTVFAPKSRQLELNSPEEIGQYEIAIVRGVQTTLNLTRGMEHVTEFTNLKQAINFVKAKRADIFITSETAGLVTLDQMQIEDIEPVYRIHTMPLYFYFRPEHADIAGRIEKSIQELFNSGHLSATIQQLEDSHW